MKERLLVAGVGLPLLLVVLLVCPAWATMLLVCAIAGIAAYELLHVAGKNIRKELYVLTILSAVLQVWEIYSARDAALYASPIDMVNVLRWAFIMLLFLLAVVGYGREGREVAFSDLCICVVGGLVFPAMYACIALVRATPEFGTLHVLAPFFIAFAGDSLSMGFGVWFGKRKMAPHVSPNKTWAGGIGGPVGSALGMLLLGFIGSHWLGYEANYLMLALLGVAANLFGQLGDLSMSLIKREVGIKDYSRLFLTHGGMLDRFDSSMFIAPVVYFAVCCGLI